MQSAIDKLYDAVAELESLYPGRPFTLDGHLVGSIGECLVADAYDLKLMPPSNTGYDATAPDGRQVEIKTTQGKSVAFRSSAEWVIVVKLYRGEFEEIYNGPGDLVWQQFEGKKRPSNGQYRIGFGVLRKLQNQVPGSQKLGLQSKENK